MQADVETSGAPPATEFHAHGPKPPPSQHFNEQPGRSPSDQAFEDAEPHWRAVAKRYNAEHSEHVSHFNSLTQDHCLLDGVLDISRVIAFQRRHGLRQDGMVGPHTVNAAHRMTRAPHHVAVAVAPEAAHDGEEHSEHKTVGHPSAEGKAVADELFREVNGGPGEASPTTPSGAPVAAPTVGHPSAEGKAEAMKLFREVNGGPGEAAPTTASGAATNAQTDAPIATDAAPRPAGGAAPPVGTPSAEGKAEAMKLFREVNGGPGEASPTTASGAPAKTVGTPSAAGSAEAMKLFREVNGGPGEASPTTPSGAPVAAAAPKTVGTPSAEGSAEAMQMFREVNGGPGQPAPTTPSGVTQSAPLAAPTPAGPEAAPKTVGTPSAEGSAEALKLFREVNGGPAQASPTTASGAPLPPVPTPTAAPHEPPTDVPSVPEKPAPKSEKPEQAEAAAKPAAEAPAAAPAHPAPAGDGKQPWDQPNAAGQFTGEHELHVSHITRAQVYQAITHVAPGYSHDFKVMMVGHSWIEQHGTAINNNYMGVEFSNPNHPGDQAYTHVRTSTMITRKQYDANPSKYADWRVGPADRNSIQQQLDRDEPMIYCTEMRNRPAYQSLDDASVAFVHQVQRRIEALQGSAKAEHQQLAADALAGDEHAYARVLTLRDRSIGIAPYNPDAGYPARVIAGITEARADATLTSLS